MLVEFASPQMAEAAFRASTITALGVAGAMSLFLALGSGGSPRLLSIKVVLLFSCVALGFALAVPYTFARNKFAALDVSEKGVRLAFQAPSPRSVFVPKSEIESVLFGLGKSGSPCYLSVKVRSGGSHQSLAINGNADTCKKIRTEIIEVLGE